jgi:predicted nucleic acid-binding protein
LEEAAMIFVDTGGWFATFVSSDPRYDIAVRWHERNRHPLLTTDYVIDETLTLLRSRGERNIARLAARRLFSGNYTMIHFLQESEIRAAAEIFLRFSDKDWSFTDCTSKVVMEKYKITTAFAFDRHFRQFGNVAVVP